MEKKEGFFGSDNRKLWQKEWQSMPEFVQEDITDVATLRIYFRSREDMEEFSELINQKLTKATKSIWHPEAEKENLLNKVCGDAT